MPPDPRIERTLEQIDRLRSELHTELMSRALQSEDPDRIESVGAALADADVEWDDEERAAIRQLMIELLREAREGDTS